MTRQQERGQGNGSGGAGARPALARGRWRRAAALLPRVALVAGQALWQAYARAALSASLRGVRMPGVGRARASLGAQTLSAYERKTLVYELKASRYQWTHGPLWLRASVDAVTEVWRANRFWLALFAKIVSGGIVLSLPLFLFLLLRGVLPVPSRVPERTVATPLAPRTALSADVPWTPLSDSWTLVARLRDDAGRVRGIPVERAEEGNAVFAIGSLPRRRELFEGRVVSEDAPLRFISKTRPRVAVEGGNRVRIPFFAFPSDAREPFPCRLEVRDGAGALLVATDFVPPARAGALASRLASLFQSRFTPDFALEPVTVRELFVDTDESPRQLDVRILRAESAGAGGGAANATGISLGSGASMGAGAGSNAASETESDAAEAMGANGAAIGTTSGTTSGTTTDRALPSDGGFIGVPAQGAFAHACLVGLGTPLFEHQRVSPFPRRGLVIVSVEGLRAEDAGDALNAPFLASLARSQAADFRQHRVSSNDPDANTAALLGAAVPDAFSGEVPAASSLAARLRARGYHAAAFGRLGFAGGRLPRNLLGFETVVSLEAREYEARHVTEETTAWIERAGESPFLALAQYSTLLPPFRPPFSHIPLGTLLASPMVLGREMTFRAALLRYVDRELGLLAGRLQALGVWDGIDFLVTSNGALPLEPRDVSGLAGFAPGEVASLRLRGSSLLDAELRVPLVWKPSGAAADAAFAVDRPTFPEDVALTLARLHGAPPPPGARGSTRDATRWAFDFSESFSRDTLLDLNSQLDERKLFPLWGTAEIGVLAFDARRRGAAKFVDQIVPRSTEFLLPGAPAAVASVVPPGEKVYQIEGGGLGAERVVSSPGSSTLGSLRALLRRAHFDGSVPLRFDLMRDARVRMIFVVSRREEAGVRELPLGLDAAWDAIEDGRWRLTVEGTARAGAAVRLAIPEGALEELTLEEGTTGGPWVSTTTSVCLGGFSLSPGPLARAIRSFHPCLYGPQGWEANTAPVGRPRERRSAGGEKAVFMLSLERAPSLAKPRDGR